MNRVDEVLILAIQMRMRIDKANVLALRGQFGDYGGMNLVGLNLAVDGLKGAPIEFDDFRVAVLVDGHGKIGQYEANSVCLRELNQLTIARGIRGFQRVERRGPLAHQFWGVTVPKENHFGAILEIRQQLQRPRPVLGWRGTIGLRRCV